MFVPLKIVVFGTLFVCIFLISVLGWVSLIRIVIGSRLNLCQYSTDLIFITSVANFMCAFLFFSCLFLISFFQALRIFATLIKITLSITSLQIWLPLLIDIMFFVSIGLRFLRTLFLSQKKSFIFTILNRAISILCLFLIILYSNLYNSCEFLIIHVTRY